MSVLQQLNDDVATLTERVKKSMVEVRTGRHGGAAGTIWHRKGLILTNAHVVGQGQPRVILPDGRTVEARVLARDRSVDLVALSVDAEDLQPIALGDSSSLEPGQYVIAVGHPRGIKNAVTAGIVMDAAANFVRVEYPEPLVMVNLLLRPGNSGGPLVDTEGRLVGINTMMTGSDTGLAIPVNVAKAFLRKEVGSRMSAVSV
jgi:serine protease Do